MNNEQWKGNMFLLLIGIVLLIFCDIVIVIGMIIDKLTVSPDAKIVIVIEHIIIFTLFIISLHKYKKRKKNGVET